MSAHRPGPRGRTLRFLAAYLRNERARIPTTEVTVPATADGRDDYDATLHHPPGPGPHPAWIMLPGLSAQGRDHPSLRRVVRAFAASGALVLAPDVPSLRACRVHSPAIRDAVDATTAWLAARDDVRADAIGLTGFSLCGTLALTAAADPALSGRIAAVFAAGAYCELGRTFHFGMTGEHEWDGRRYRCTPNPYGRWIASLNYLTLVPSYEDMAAVADGLGRMGRHASLNDIKAGDPALDTMNAGIEHTLEPRARELWRFLAPPSGALPPDRDRAAAYARALCDAALAHDPGLELADPLPLRCRLIIAHGRGDRIVPFTEAYRLADRFDRLEPSLHVLGYAHSGPDRGGTPGARLRHAWRLCRLARELCEVIR